MQQIVVTFRTNQFEKWNKSMLIKLIKINESYKSWGVVVSGSLCIPKGLENWVCLYDLVLQGHLCKENYAMGLPLQGSNASRALASYDSFLIIMRAKLSKHGHILLFPNNWNILIKHRKNYECCHHNSVFKGHNVIVHIVVLNCQKCNQWVSSLRSQKLS